MKTSLPAKIETIEQAKAFLSELIKNKEDFHPEDDALEVDFSGIAPGEQPTFDECRQLNKLMGDIYKLPGNENPQNMAFDPCGFMMDLLADSAE